MNIFSEDFWEEATNTKSKVYMYRVFRQGKGIVIKVLEVDAKMPISEITRKLGGLPMGVVTCDEGKIRAKELALEDFISKMVEEVKANV